jgi:hypothetical protein
LEGPTANAPCPTASKRQCIQVPQCIPVPVRAKSRCRQGQLDGLHKWTAPSREITSLTVGARVLNSRNVRAVGKPAVGGQKAHAGCSLGAVSGVPHRLRLFHVKRQQRTGIRRQHIDTVKRLDEKRPIALRRLHLVLQPKSPSPHCREASVQLSDRLSEVSGSGKRNSVHLGSSGGSAPPPALCGTLGAAHAGRHLPPVLSSACYPSSGLRHVCSRNGSAAGKAAAIEIPS